MEMKFIFDIQRFAFSGGSGTASSPYIISTAADLKYLAENVSDWSVAQAHYKLGANIDLANADFKAIGTEKNPFKGNFDGDGHTISNLKISAGTYEGLFGYTEGATIQSVTVSNITTQTYDGNNQYVGGIAGYAKNSTFENCIVESGTITGNNSANLGGIVGYVFVNDGSTASEKGMAHSLIQECQVKSAVEITPANSWVNSAGGIVGNAEVTSRQPCVGWSDFSVYLCNSNATFNFQNNSATTGGIIGKLTPKVLTNARNLTVFYNIGVHDSFFGGNTASNNNDFASIVGTVNFPESKYTSSLGETGSPLRLSGNYYYSASGNELNTASNVADHVSESKKPTRLYKISVPEGIKISDVQDATKTFDGNVYATQGATVTFKLSATDGNCIIYGDLDLGSATYYEGTYTAKISKVDDPEDPDYNKYKDVEIGIGTAELRQVKGDGWSYDTSTKKLSITKDLTDFTSENSEWYVWHDDITSVEIASGVTKIPAYAFQNCGNISSFNNKGNITSIGTGAFDGTQYKKLTMPTSGITVSGATFSLGGDYYIKQGDEVTLTLTAGYLSGKNAVDVRFLEYGHYGSIKINSRTYNTSDTTTSITFNMPKENIDENIFNFAPVISGLTFNSAGRYYEIKDAQDMVDLATYIASGKDNFGYGTTGGEYLTFKMTADIDMSTVTDFHGIGTINHYPIAMGEGNAFSGTFDGDGHKISGLNINNISAGSSNPNYAGLFSWVSEFSGLHGRSQAVIKNLTVVSPQVTGGNAVGGIAGYVGTNVLIENCKVTGGTLSGNYKSSANRSFSTYSSSLGGIAGDCVSVSSKSDAAQIKNCTVINPTFEGGNKGALTGRGGYFISPNRYYLADKSINFVGGGFTGGEGGGSTPLYKVTDVAGDSITVSNITCADDSKVEIDGTTYYKQGAVLTFTVNNTDSNFVPAVGGTELSKSGNTYTYTVGKSDVEISALFKIEGEGTEASPYLIKNANALKYFAEQVNAGNSYEGKFIKLNDDITFTDNTFPPIGIDNPHPFKGNFDGNDKTITATITKSGLNYVSLFGYNYGTIENLNLNATFTSERAPASGICSSNYGTIKNVKLSGSIESTNSAACGICGSNYGTIEGCVVDNISGLTAAIAYHNMNGGYIENCINATNSKSVSNNKATVTNSYSTSGIAITLPTDTTNIKVNDGVTATTYDNSGITAYEGGGILYDGKLYLNEGEKVKLTTTDANNKIFDADLKLVELDANGYYTATATADLSALKSLTVKGDGWNFDAETGKLSITSNSAFTSSSAWYELRSKIKTVELASGVTEIGASAFKDFTEIENFTVGGTITNVGTDAFTDSKIKVVSLPERTEVTEGGLFTVGQNAYVLGDTLVYRYTDGYTKGTNFSVSGASSSVNETNEIVTLSGINGNVTVTDTPVALSGNGDIGDGLTWKVESTSDSTNDYLVISGNGAITDFTTAEARPEGFKTNLGTIKKVYIGPGVTHIGSNIFAGMNLSEVRIATKYYSNSTYDVAPTYSQVEIANDAFGSGQRVYRIDLPVNAYPKMNDSAYKVISNYQENGANTWYISKSNADSFNVQILTPIGYNLVDNNGNTISRTISISTGTSTYSISGTSNEIWTGTGTETDPFLIKTQADLQLLAATSPESQGFNSFSGYHFRLDADNLNWGNVSIPSFKGTFEGNNKTVTASGSLFDTNNGTIKNLTISNTSTNANFVNENSSGGTVENCVNNSAISGTGNVGGIVNDNYGNVKNCTNNGNITCTGKGNTNYESAGGIVGVQRSGNGSLTYCTNNGAVSGTSYVGGIIGNMQGCQYVQHNFNGGAVTGTIYVGGIVGRKSDGNLSQNYYGGSCTTCGVNGTDADGAKKGYKLVFTTAGNYADKTKIESMLVGSGETLTPTLTKGYKATTLSSNDATFTQDTNGDYKFTTTSTKSEITVTATVDLDAVNLTSENPTAEITQYDTKTIRVNGEDRLKFVSGRDYSNATPIELQDGNLKITGYGIEIPADKNSSVSNLNVINSRADINGTDEVDNVTVSNFTLQGSILYDSGSHAAYLQSSYSNISLNGGADNVTVQDTSIVGGDLKIDGGADADNIKVQRVTVSSATIAGTDADNNTKIFARGGVLNIYGDEGNDIIEVANVKYNTTDDDGSEYSNNHKIGGGEGNDSIKVSNISVEGLSKLTVEGGAGDDTISVANISGEGIVTIDGGDGSDNIDVDGNAYVYTKDNYADNITIGGGATVEAGAKDIITVKQGSSAVIKFGEKLITVTPENVDAVFNVTADGLSIANNFDGVIEGDELSFVTDSLGGKLDSGKTKAFITNGVISVTTIELDATNSSATLEPSSTAYTVKILKGENNSYLELSPISVSEQTTITANFDGANYKSLDVSGGKVNVVFDATKTKPINFKGGVQATVTDNDNSTTEINWKDLFNVEGGSRVDINLDGGANTFTITDSSVKDGISYVTGGAGNNTFRADNITVESSNSTSGIAYDAKGGNDTISVSNATLNGVGENLAAVALALAGGTESVSVENVSLNGGYFQVSGESEGNDELSFKNISAQNATFEVNESEYTANRENLSVNIDIEDVTLKGSQFGAQGYNASISVNNINVDSDSYLGLSNDYGDGNLEVDGATVASSGRMLIYGSNEGKETVKLQNMSIESGALIFAKTYGGDDTISVASISGEGVISIDSGAGSDSISIGGGNVYVKGGEDSDTIIIGGKGSTVDATDDSDVITVKQNSNAVLDFGEGNLATVTATSADVNFSEGKLKLTQGWSGSVDGTVKLSTLPETFTLNDKTYAPKTVGDKKVLTYTKDNGTTYLYDGELDFDNLTTADLATDNWIPVAFVTVTDKTFSLPTAPAETVYIVDDKNLTKYAQLKLEGGEYHLANVDGNSAVRDMTIDISKFGKDISIETNKNLNHVHIKTANATFQVQMNFADEIKIGSDGKFLTAADYFVESSTGNLSAVEKSMFIIQSNGANKSITVNGKTYTTNNWLEVYATADSSYMDGGVVILKDGESIPVFKGTLSVIGDTDGVEMKVTGVNFWYIKNLADGGTVNCKGTTYTRTGNEIAVKTSDAQTIYNYENDYFNVMNRGDGLQYVKVDGAINLTGDVATAIYGKDEIYSATNYLAKLEKIVYVDDNYDEHTRYELTKRDGLTDQLKVIVDDGKVLTANFDAEVTATGSVTINDKVYTAAKDSLTIVTGDKSSTLTGGTLALDSEVLVTGGKSMKFTATDDVKTLDVTISEDVIKDFNVTAGKFEILGTENADNISVTGAQVASDNLFSISGGAGDDIISVDDISGGVATIDGGDGADVITVGNGALVKADSADKITVTKNKSAVIMAGTTPVNVTAGNSDFAITIDTDAINFADGTNTFTVKVKSGVAVTGNSISGAENVTLKAGSVTIGEQNISVTDDNDGVSVAVQNNKISSISGLNDGGSVTYNEKVYKRVGNYIFIEADKKVFANIDDTTNIAALGEGTNYVVLEGTKIELADYSADTIFFDTQKNLLANYENNSLTINSGTYTVKTSGGVTIGSTIYNSDGALEISASKDSSSVINGTVNVAAEQFGVKVSDDSNGVAVTFADGKISSISGLNDGGTVNYNGKTYKRTGDKIFLDGKVYNVDKDTNILNLTGGTAYVEVTEKVIDLTSITEPTIFVDANRKQLAEFKDNAFTVDDESYTLKLPKGTFTLNGTAYKLFDNGTLISTEPSKLFTGNSFTTADIANSSNWQAAQIIDGTIDISNVNDTTAYLDAAGNKIAQFSEGTLTINKDNAANINVTQTEKAFKIISADANVTVNSQFQISGASSISLTKGGVEIGGEYISTGGENSDGVTIGIADGKATSITDLKTDKEFVVVDVNSTGEVTSYDRAGNEIIKQNHGTNKTTIYTVSADDNPNVLGLSGGIEYVATYDGSNQINKIDLTDVTTEKIYGINDSYSADNYFAKLTVDGDKYTLTKRNGTDDLENLQITLGANKTLDAKFAATVKTSGNVTVNGFSYNASGEVEIFATADGSSVINGVVKVAAEQFGVKVSDDSNGVAVTFANKNISSISGLDDGGSVTYDGKTYKRVGNYIFEGAKAYACDDTTNILELGDGVDYLEITDSIDISKLSAGMLIVDANKNIVATYDGNNLKVTGDIKLASITNLQDGGSVTYNGKTYTRNGNEISDGTNTYSITDGSENLLELSGAILYVQITNAIDLTTAKSGTFYGTAEKFSSDGYFAVLAIDEKGAYQLTKRNGADDIAGLTIDAGNISTVTTNFAAQVKSTADNVIVNDVEYISDGELTISTTADGSTLYNGVIIVKDKTQEGVTAKGDVKVTKSGGAVTSISGLDDGESVEYNGKTYTNTNNFIFSDGKAYGIDGTTNILALSTAALFTVNGVKSAEGLKVEDKVVTVAASSLDENSVVTISEGYELKLGDDVVKPVTQNPTWTLDGTKAIYKATTTAGYVLVDNKISYAEQIDGTTLITVDGVKSLDGLKFDTDKNILTLTNITSAVIVNGTSYTPSGTLEISIGDTQKIISGTVIVTAEQFGVKVSNDSDGVSVTFKDSAISSITGLNDGGSINYNGKTYKRVDKNIFVNENTVYPNVTDSSDILNLLGGTSYVTIDGTTIDLRGLAGSAVFTDKDKNQIATLTNGVLAIVGGDDYTVLTNNAVAIGGNTYTPAKDTLTISANKDSAYLVDGVINLSGTVNLNGGKSMKSTAELAVTVDKDTLKNISQVANVGFTVEGSSNADTINLSNSTFATVAAVYGNAGDDSITVSDISGNGAVLSDGGAGDDNIIATNGNIFANGGEGADQITISGANAFVSSDDTITVKDKGVIMSADGKLAAAVIGDMVYEVDKNINFSDNVTIEGNLSVFGYSDALYSMQITNADVTKMGFYLSPYQPSIQLQSSSVTAYDITALTSDGNVAKTYTNIFAYDAPILTATYNNGTFDKLNVEGIAYIEGDTVTAEDLRIVDGGRFEVYGNGKISVDDVELNGTGENDGFGISGGDDADEISIGNINLSNGFFEGYGGTGNDTISIDNVNISGGDFAFFGNGNTTSVESSDDDNISAQNITMTGGTFDIEGNVGNDSITAKNINLSGSAQFGIGGNEGDDTILVDGLNVNSNAIAYVDGGIDNDSISAANITGEGVLTINGGSGDDTISIDDSANIFVQMSDGSDTVIVGGAKILDSSTANNGKSSLKKVAESADTAQEVAATVEANSADTVTIQENGKAYIIYGDKTFFIESSKGELTFKNGKAILADGWAGTLSDDTPITLTDGTFSLSGKTYSYDADEKVLSYVDSDGNRHVYTGDVENITANNFVDDGTNYELKLNEVICADGVIKLEGVTENSYFVDSNGNRLAKLEDNYLTKVANGVTLIDTTGYGKAVTIDSHFQNTPIKTVDGTFTFGGIAFVAGQTNSITIDAEGKVSDATTGLFRYTLTSGGINIFAGANVDLNGEGTVNGAKFKTTTNSMITPTANSAYAYIGTFIVTDSLNYSSSGVMSVENDSDGVIFTREPFNNAITGLNDGGKLTYGGKSYQRKGDYIFSDGKAYACDDTTNILQLKNGVDYLEITDSIDISKLSAGLLIVDADKNIVATYDGTTLKVTGDVELKSINGLPDGGIVEYGGKTYTRQGDKLYLDGSVYDFTDGTNILELGGGVNYYEVADSIDISKLSAGMLIVDANKNIVAEYDGKNLKVTGDVELKSIINLQDGGTVEYNGVTYTRKGNKIYADGRVYDVDDSTNILAMGDGELYTEIVNNIIDLTKNSEMVFGINDVKVATYSGGVLTIDSGTFTVKTSGGVTIGGTTYNANGALEISASKNSSSVINGTVNVAAEQFGVKVKNDSDGVNVKFENGAITSITGLADGGSVEYGGKTFTRNGNLIYLDGKIYEVDDSTNILAMTGGVSYVEVNDTIDISGITEPVIFIKNSAQVATYSGGKLTIDSGTFTVKTSGSVTIGSTTYNSDGALEISANKNSSNVINGTVKVSAEQFGVKVENDSDGVAVTFANKNISSISGLNDGGTVTYGGKTYNRTGDKIFIDGKVYFVDDSTNILNMGNGSDYVTVTNSIDISKLSAGAVIVDANKNIVATYEEKTLNVTGDITLTSITNLQDGGTVNYKGVTYSRNGNRISNGTKTFIGDATANLLDLEKLPEVVNIDGTLNLTGIKDGSIITRNGVEIIKVGKNGNGYKLTKLNNAANGITIDAGNIGTVNLDFDATIKTLGSVTVNGTNYKTVSGGVNVSVKDGKIYLQDGYVSMDKTLQTADGKIYTKLSGSANVLVESGTLTSIKNFVGKIEGDFTNSTGVNGSALQVLDDNDITIEAKNTNGLYEIGGLSPNMIISLDGGANRFTTDGGGEFTIGGKLYKLSSSGTLDKNGNIFNFKGSVQSPQTTYTINGKKVTASKAGLTFVTDGYKITEIRGLKDGDWVSGDIDGAQFTLPNGSVTFNGTTYTVKSDFNGVIVKGDTISNLDAGAELSIDKAGYYQVNGTYFTLDANQPIYGVFNPNDLRLTATENQKTADLFNANTPIEPGDSATFIKIDEGTSIFDIKPVDIKINPNESAAVTSGQALQVEVWNGQAFTIYSPPDGSNAMIWQNGNGTTETGGTTNVFNYDASNGSGIQTNQNNFDDLLNQFINGNYSASSEISVDVGDGFDLFFTFINSAGGTTNFNTPTSTSGDLAAEIAKVNVENGMLANFYTFDGKANQFAWTGNSGGIIDGSNARTDLIMQGNFNGTNNGGSNLFGGSANNAFLAGSGDNVYLGTGKNDVYLNKNREDKGGVGIYAYDSVIKSNGNSSDLAEIDGQSADATGEKNYSSVVNNFKFGFDYDSDILYISGNSSSRDIKQNFIEPLKEMFASLVDEINDAENDSTENSSADLAESAMIINRPISAVNKNSLKAISMLRQSNRQVDLISQAAIGVNTSALSTQIQSLQSRLSSLKITPISINTSTTENNSDKNSTNNTTSTIENNSDKNSTDNTTSTTENISDKNSTNNTTTLDYNEWFDKYEVDVYKNFDCAEYAADFYQFMRADGRRYLQYGFGTTTGSWRNYWYSEEKKEQFIQQLMQQYQAEGLPERWAERAWAKKKNIEMSILKDALEDKNNYDSFSTQWQSWTFPIEDLVAALEQSKESEKWTKNFNSYQLDYWQKTAEVTPPSVEDAVPAVKKSKKGDITYKDSVQLKSPVKSASSGDAADGSDLGNVDYTKLIVGYEDGTVKTAIAGKGAVINLDWNGDERAEEYIGENSGVDVGEYEGTVAINLNTGVGVLDGDEAIIIGGVDKLKAGSGAAMFVGSADAPNTLMGGSGDSSIWGGGDTKDLLVGYSGEDKSGSTNFFYVKGDGKDTIESFAYLTSDNDYKADEINFLENSVTKIHINGKDVYLTVESDDDILKVTDAVGKDFKVRNNNTAVIAQVGESNLTYDRRANYFYAAGRNATLTVDGSVQTAEIWLNGASGEYFTGDIKVLDAAQVEGRTTLVGNDYNNVIIAGKDNSSMWGGNSSSNDTLIGGEGSDNFFYTFGNGNDSINGATAEDMVNLFDVNLEQISNVEVSEAAVKINFTDCGSLTVNGDTSGLTYKVGGENYIVNQSTRNWTKK